MTETAQPVHAEKPEAKEADHHPYYRPKDAATLILVDRSGAIPKVLVGRRHDKVVFMPGKFVFPGGRTDPCSERDRDEGDRRLYGPGGGARTLLDPGRPFVVAGISRRGLFIASYQPSSASA